MSTQRKTGKPSKTRENAGDRVTIGFRLRLIGYEDGASFLKQSRTELMQNQNDLRLFSTLNRKFLYTACLF